MFGDGRTRLQPAYADDVAAAIAEVVRQTKKPYPIYELAGPRVYSYEELLRTIARSAGLRPVLVRMPFAFWDAVAGLAEILPQPPLTRNQIELMQIDTTASENRPGFRALGISPRSAYIKRNKHDAADAEAICEAVGRPTMQFVPVKTAEQQANQLLHRGREQLVRQRTMLVNALRAHL